MAVVRDVWQGAILNGRPLTVVQDTDELVALYLAPGTTHLSLAEYSFDREEREQLFRDFAERPVVERVERTWRWTRCLTLMRPGDPYSVWGMWDEGSDELVAWYVNLQEPFTRTAIGFDTMDHIIDIVVSPDLSTWEWKDLNEGELVVELGLAPRELLDEVRRNGEAVAELVERGDAWWTDWRDWAPDPSWPVPSLPEGWDER